MENIVENVTMARPLLPQILAAKAATSGSKVMAG
jgi:hypothetical protein